MKTKIVLSQVLVAILLMSLTGCNFDKNWFSEPEYYDNTPPPLPYNVEVINGDKQVEIRWNYQKVSDLSGFNVYVSETLTGKYLRIGSTANSFFIDNGVTNGRTYYYAITAYDYNNNESEMSRDIVYTTPRPEGMNQAIYNYRSFTQNSGYDFSAYKVLPYNNNNTDVFFENYDGTYYLNVWDDSDIRDMGAASSIYDYPYAPVSGWDTIKYVKAIPGHTYVVWTWDNHFAKIYVKAINRDRIVFDWSYQTVEGNIDLKPVNNDKARAIKSSTNR